MFFNFEFLINILKLLWSGKYCQHSEVHYLYWQHKPVFFFSKNVGTNNLQLFHKKVLILSRSTEEGEIWNNSRRSSLFFANFFCQTNWYDKSGNISLLRKHYNDQLTCEKRRVRTYSTHMEDSILDFNVYYFDLLERFELHCLW